MIDPYNGRTGARRRVQRQTLDDTGAKRANGSARVVAGHLADVAHDIVELTELQSRLLVNDLKMVVQRAVLPVIALCAALCLAQGAVPVLLLAIARFAGSQSNATLPLAFALTALGTLIVSSLMAWLGWKKLQKSLEELERTKLELSRNIAWIKKSLRREEAQ